MKRFVFDSVVDAENICNLEKERKKIKNGIDSGLKLLVYGKRNMGKTSLVRNVAAAQWLKRNPSGFFLYADLLGVRNTAHISERMTIAFVDAYNACFKMKSIFNKMLKVVKTIRPAIEIDEAGRPKLSFNMGEGDKKRPFTKIIQQLDSIFTTNIPVLLVLDEFQDIALIEQAEALFRKELEQIDANIPIVIMGSKYHLLNRIFARPSAPFFNWGTHVYFETIDYHEYWQYMQERFKQKQLSISFQNAKYLQDKMSRMPEAINRLCFALLNAHDPQREISQKDIDAGLASLVYDRRKEPENYLAGFTTAEQNVMIHLSKTEPVAHPQGKDFIQRTGLTAAGVRKILIKLEDQAVVYKEDSGYVLADPLLKQHILRFRL